MSEEEKKAIEYLKRYIIPVYGSKGQIEYLLNEIVLNLIEKQQKEIEELKEENKEIRQWKYTIDTIEDLDRLKELDLIKIKGKEYISKDKMRELIKDINEETQYLGKDRGETKQHYAVRKIQELLEESE